MPNGSYVCAIIDLFLCIFSRMVEKHLRFSRIVFIGYVVVNMFELIFRTWWFRWSQIQDLPGFARRCGDQLCR